MTGKQLHHIIRLYQFLTNLLSGMTYKLALTHFDTELKDVCMKAKLNKYSLQEARELAEKYSTAIHTLKEEYILKITSDNTIDNIVKNNVVNLLLDLKSKILKYYFKEQLLVDYKEPFKLCPDQYKNVWVTSDTHFGHTNIIKYENRAEKLNITNVEEHDRELINRWNSVVDDNDLILILGDFSFKKAKDTNDLLKQLNGNKVLIKGNHDIFLDDKNFDKSLFKAIYDYKETKYKGQEIALMHYPIQDFKHQNKEVSPAILLFGHIHSFKMLLPKHSYNVGVDINNYYPIKLETAIEKALSNNGNIINGEI